MQEESRNKTDHRARLLVIDDEQGMRDMLAFELRREGFDVTTAASGQEAIELVRKSKYDIAVTDLKMPGMDGVETLEALKAIDPEIEVIIATGYATVDTAITCMKRGAYDYIQKPFDLNELQLLIDKAIEKRHLSGMIALYQASGAMLATLRHDDLIRVVLETAHRSTRSAAVALVLCTPAENGYDVHRLSGLQQPSELLLVDLARRTIDTGGPLRLTASQGDGSPPCVAEGYTSCLAFPLQVHGQELGALILLREADLPVFSSSDEKEGTVLATQAALALDNARLIGELEHKIEELVSTRDDLVRAEKLAMAGQLAGAVAHEVNNPLGYVRAGLSSLGAYVRDFDRLWQAARQAAAALEAADDPAARLLAAGILDASEGGPAGMDERIRDATAILEECLEGTSRIASLVAGFTHLAVPGNRSDTQLVDVESLVQQYLEPITSRPDLAGRGIQPDIETCGATEVSRQDVESALSNILAFLRTQPTLSSPSACPIRVRVGTSSGQPVIELTDPDLRLSHDELNTIFDPRIDVDRRDGHTMRLDIGLAIAHQMLMRNKASLVARSHPEGGTTFRILLPAATQAPDRRNTAGPTCGSTA